MKKILTTLLILTSQYVFSQEIKGIIRDHSNLKAIPYASVYYAKAEIGAYSDSTGSFHIPKILGDTLVISAIGFEKSFILVDNTTNTINVSLVPLTVNLAEVVIKGKKYGGKKKGKTLRLGNLSSKHDVHTSGIKGRTVAYLVKNEAGIEGQIKSIHYSINQSRFYETENAIVKVHLYIVNPITGKPGEDLLLNAEVVKVRKEDKNLVVDVEYLGIELPLEGIYIGLEWMDFSPWYTLSKSTKSTAFYTKFLGKDWQLSSVQKVQPISTKKGKNKVQQIYYEEPNFNITVVK